MLAIPRFEKVAVIGGNPRLIAEVSSLFTRPKYYLPVLSEPHLLRPDWSNEVIRRTNALAMAQSRRVLLAEMSSNQNRVLSEGRPKEPFIAIKSREDAQTALKGWIREPKEIMAWGRDNLGVGLLVARCSRKLLVTTDGESPPTSYVGNGTHLLIVCERGRPFEEIIASNLAFATAASFLMISELPETEKLEWLEELYTLESSYRFSIIRDRVRRRLPHFEFSHYKQILFVTNSFPWGIAVPERPTTHMLAFPDFGRSIIEGLWAAAHPENCARTALMIQPDKVLGAEIGIVRESLVKNRTLVRVQQGPLATARDVRMLIETVPFDIIVFSTHAGDVPGQRVTYEFTDSEGIDRCLVIDEAVGFESDSISDRVLVERFSRFHQLDGIEWTDTAAKAKLYIGSAIDTWSAMEFLERNKYRVASEEISRVMGSMGLQMSDRVWVPALHGFPPRCAPLVFNNACASWHRLSAMFMFAGARAYIGTLFSVWESEAHEMGKSFFHTEINTPLQKALWASQNRVYQGQDRRPYVMVGLPFFSIQRNRARSANYLLKYYANAISDYGRSAEMTPYRELRDNYLRYKEFLTTDSQMFENWMYRSVDSGKWQEIPTE